MNEIALKSDYTNFPLKIVKEKFTYIGINITRKHKDLYKENFLPLLNKVKNSLTQWSPLSTSLVGRINSIKMNTLPKFLYIFQSVPNLYLNRFLTHWTQLHHLTYGKANPLDWIKDIFKNLKVMVAWHCLTFVFTTTTTTTLTCDVWLFGPTFITKVAVQHGWKWS